MYQKTFKPIFDLLFASIVLMAFLPLLVLISVIGFVFCRGKVFFIQDRVGLKGKIFKIIKFRTLKDVDENGHQEFTAIGKYLRRTSLDELPQLINIIKGEMSFIGPRPLLVEYLPLYNEFQAQRHKLKPGITGWAQVNGRNAIEWKKRFEFDIYYVNNCSLFLDIKIGLLTIVRIFSGLGVNSSSGTFVEKFKGN